MATADALAAANPDPVTVPVAHRVDVAVCVAHRLDVAFIRIVITAVAGF